MPPRSKPMLDLSLWHFVMRLPSHPNQLRLAALAS
jgi:hypothetical protein